MLTRATVALIGDTRPRRALSERIIDLIASWGHCNTNKRCTLFDARLVLVPRPGQPDRRLHPEASQDLTAALYPHKQHT
jgi:hypothetical protein